MQGSTSDSHIKRMAELLRQGATLTDLSCPNCSSPLFRLRDGTYWCGKDEKKVIIVKEGEEPPAQVSSSPMGKLEATLTAKISDVEAKIEKTDNIDELTKLTTALNELLGSLEKVKKMKKG
jgi:UPF0148 protein